MHSSIFKPKANKLVGRKMKVFFFLVLNRSNNNNFIQFFCAVHHQHRDKDYQEGILVQRFQLTQD